MVDEHYRSRVEMEELERVFITQQQFGDYKVEIAKVLGDIKGSVRTIKYFNGLVLVAIAVDILVTLLRLKP